MTLHDAIPSISLLSVVYVPVVKGLHEKEELMVCDGESYLRAYPGNLPRLRCALQSLFFSTVKAASALTPVATSVSRSFQMPGGSFSATGISPRPFPPSAGMMYR